MNTLSKLQDIFRDFFDDEGLALTNETSSDDIEGWDSLAQVNIIVMCESEFGVKFDFNDIAKLKNVGDIVDTVEGKLKS
jgi:acyl carrier protein